MAEGNAGKFKFLEPPVGGISRKPKIVAQNLSIRYRVKADVRIGIENVSLEIPENLVTSLIGASGCGKSSFLRSINRMNDTIDGAETTGLVTVDGHDIYNRNVDTTILRSRVGMVFQKPNPFPKSIYENVAYGPRIHGLAKNKADRDVIVERSLRRAGVWNEVKDKLDDYGTALSGGQQQRLVIARALALNPEVLLMDEPCSSLDPISTADIEETIAELSRDNVTVLIVTHNMQQAARVSHKTAFFNMGHMVEEGCTEEMFTRPKKQETEDYITGRFG